MQAQCRPSAGPFKSLINDIDVFVLLLLVKVLGVLVVALLGVVLVIEFRKGKLP